MRVKRTNIEVILLIAHLLSYVPPPALLPNLVPLKSCITTFFFNLFRSFATNMVSIPKKVMFNQTASK